MPRAASTAAFVAVGIALALLGGACGRNPVLGDWEIDPSASSRRAVLAAEAADLGRLSLRGDAIVAGDTEIPVAWTVEGPVARAVRGDGRGEHRAELLPDGRLRVELPIGVTAVYHRAGS
jgi:hypothetical protein